MRRNLKKHKLISKGNDHVIKNCLILVAKEAKKKEPRMVVVEASTPKTESTNLVWNEQ